MSFSEDLINASWVVWFIIIGIIIFILWIFVGGGNYEYVGLAPLKIGVDSTKYVDEQVHGIIERSDYHAEKVSGIDITPSLPQNLNNLEFSNQPTYNNNTTVLHNLTPITTTPITTTPFEVSKPGRKCSKGERICREVIEEIYSKPFPNCRPGFLKNPETKRNLELDCYNDELKIAVEYNGIQHYKWPNFTNHSQEEFVKQIRRDKFKVETCDLNGVYLITVPYNVPHDKIKNYITYYLPENYYQRLDNEKNPNQVYMDLRDYNDDFDFDGTEYSDEYSDDESNDYTYEYNDEHTEHTDEHTEHTEHSDEYTKYDDDNMCSAIFSEEDLDILRSYEISYVTNH